jgi:diguanylate cyclase (GGDEF)-like protein/PAS domain S-box-containing protein
LDSLADGVYFVDRNRKILYWNRGAEQISGFDRGTVLNRFCHDNLLRHVNAKGQPLCGEEICLLYRSLQTGQTVKEDEVYLHHQNGHRVPVSVTCKPWRDEGGNVVGAVEVFHEFQSRTAMENEIARLKQLALLDPLTGVGNRRYGEIRIDACLNELTRHNWPFGVLFIDVDHFKRVNDIHGHETGDQVLQTVARTVAHNIRSYDEAIRWGGEEFVCILINQNETAFRAAAEKIRGLIEQSTLEIPSTRLVITASIGATLAKPTDSMDSLIERADQLMYRSKESGRNQVTFG